MFKKTLNSIGKLLVKEQSEIVSAAAVLMVLALATKMVGMVYLSLVAREFGASRETDLFYLASLIPETITNIILLGAISGSIIPIFVGIKEKEGKEQFSRSFSSVMNLGVFMFAVLSAIAIVFAYQLIPLATQLFNTSVALTPEEVETVAQMMRILLIPQVILGISAFVSSGLNIYHRFIIPSLAPLFYNFGKILGILIIVPLMDFSIWGLVWGTLFGAILHLAIQIPLWKHLKIGYKFLYFNFTDGSFIEVVKLGLPRALSLGVEEIARVIDSLIAFSLVPGSLTAYQYGARLIAIPLNLFGTSYAVASFPALSKFYANKEMKEFERTVFSVFQQILFLAIPVSVILMVLRVPLVRLVYGLLGGNFTWEDTLQVAWVVLFFAIGVSFESLRSTMFRVYYSIHNSIIPSISSVIVVFLGIVTGLAFTNYLSHFDKFALDQLVWNLDYFFSRGEGTAGVGGLALSSSLVFSLEFFILLFVLRYKKVLTGLRVFFKELGLKIVAGIIMFLTSYLVYKIWEELLRTDKTFELLLLTILTIVIAFAVYFLVSYVFEIKEFLIFAKLFLNYLRKTKRVLRNK